MFCLLLYFLVDFNMVDSDESIDMFEDNNVRPSNSDYFKPLSTSTQHSHTNSLKSSGMLMHIGHTLKTGKLLFRNKYNKNNRCIIDIMLIIYCFILQFQIR